MTVDDIQAVAQLAGSSASLADCFRRLCWLLPDCMGWPPNWQSGRVFATSV